MQPIAAGDVIALGRAVLRKTDAEGKQIGVGNALPFRFVLLPNKDAHITVAAGDVALGAVEKNGDANFAALGRCRSKQKIC